MDIKILDSWLKEYLATKAGPEKIAEYLSLCGPSVERVEKVDGESIYDIEVTTNRVDAASVYGIAREASAILPRFRVEAKLKRIPTQSPQQSFVKKVSYLDALVDTKLCQRFTAVLIKNVTIDHSPDWMAKRVEASGIRAINNVVDISNYIMLALGQPVHTFDYDKIEGAKMILRESKSGESITTLDGKKFDLPGGDIVIEDGAGRLIDLAGVMGGALSMVDENTKNVLLFVQTYNPVNIRKTSMGLAQRTQAATIFEKGTDTELVGPGILNAIELFKTLCRGIPEKEILDIYPNPYKPVKINVDEGMIQKRLGVDIPKKDITQYLNSLDFESVWHGGIINVVVPSFRAKDVTGEEDIIEEIARIYGYHNLPSSLMTCIIPDEPQSSVFAFEENIKNILSGFGGCEVYTLSLVPEDFTDEGALKLKNPLGTDTEYLRTSLMPSLMSAAKENLGNSDTFHLFEMSNVYLPKPNDLPEERLILGGIIYDEYRKAKGIVEAFLQKLHIEAQFVSSDTKGFSASHIALIKSGSEEIGLIGQTDDGFIYYEFSVGKLMKAVNPLKYKEISKYPAQIEALTINLAEKTKVGDVLTAIKKVSPNVSAELTDIYDKKAHTFKILYHDPNKTLTNEDVEKIRKEILSVIKTKFGGALKD